MQIFKRFQKPVVLHCYTSRAEVFNYAPIEKAIKFIPESWKKIPKHVTLEEKIAPNSTMKSCVGITDLYKSGFILPMWCDLSLKVGKLGSKSYEYIFADGMSKAMVHPAYQRGELYPEEKYQHFKIETPWIFSCEEDINFIYAEPTWNIDAPEIVKVLPGVLNFKYQTSCNVNTIWSRQADDMFYTVDFKQPLAHLIPVTERKVELKLHLVSSEKFWSLGRRVSRLTFLNKYANLKRELKIRGCPFHSEQEK